jgi:uncharacterized protein YqfB (UPF0267 family)
LSVRDIGQWHDDIIAADRRCITIRDASSSDLSGSGGHLRFHVPVPDERDWATQN